MYALLLVGLACLTAPAGGEPPTAAPAIPAAQAAAARQAATVQLRPLHEWTRTVHLALVREARAATDAERVEAVGQLVRLYNALGSDPRLETSDTLRPLRVQLWNRLRRVQRRMQGPTNHSPGEAVDAGGAGGAAVRDHGPELVELIERTIAPPVWEAQGGPASIAYFESLRVLVVRASSEVHRQAAALLDNLRAAGGP